MAAEAGLMVAETAVSHATVQAAPPGLQGFDADEALSSEVAAGLRRRGFTFCLRYVSRSTPSAPDDLSLEETEAILAGGLALMVVQHAPKAGWVPGRELGARYGMAAAANARSAGIKEGVNVWLDLEGVASGIASEDVIGYCNSWFEPVSEMGYRPGVYVGCNSILSGDELYWRLRTKHYWKSGSEVPEIPYRGYQLHQRITSIPDVINGIDIDRDVSLTDGLGGTAYWLSLA
jgi:hypothetical protein